MESEMEKAEVVFECFDGDEAWADLAEDDNAALRWEEKDRHRRLGDAAPSGCSVRVAWLVQEVRRVGVCFDYIDVVLDGIDSILERYGLRIDGLSAFEFDLLRSELLVLGGRVQTGEVLRSVPEMRNERFEFVRPLGKRDERGFVRFMDSFTKVFCAGLRKEREQDSRSEVVVAEKILGGFDWRDRDFVSSVSSKYVVAGAAT